MRRATLKELSQLRLDALAAGAPVSDSATAAETADRQLDALRTAAADRRRDQVLQLLRADPNVRRAIIADLDDPKFARLTWALRGVATFELRLPMARYDGILIADLLARRGPVLDRPTDRS